MGLLPDVANSASNSEEQTVDMITEFDEILLTSIADTVYIMVTTVLWCFSFSYSQLRSTRNEIFIYRAYGHLASDLDMDTGEAKFAFKRVRSDMLCQQALVDDDEVMDEVTTLSKCTFYPFSSIGANGYEGVFVAGEKPIVILAKSLEAQLDQLQGNNQEFLQEPGTSSHHTEIFIHPIDVDGPLAAFAEFNNINCPSGFLALNSRSALRFCSLMNHFTYDAPLPFANVPFGDLNPDHVVYHHTSQTYVVSGAFKVPFYLKKAEYSSGVAAGVIDVNDEETKPVFEERGTFQSLIYTLE